MVCLTTEADDQSSLHSLVMSTGLTILGVLKQVEEVDVQSHQHIQASLDGLQMMVTYTQ